MNENKIRISVEKIIRFKTLTTVLREHLDSYRDHLPDEAIPFLNDNSGHGGALIDAVDHLHRECQRAMDELDDQVVVGD